MSGEVWTPSAVGDFFMLVMPKGYKRLMRVTGIVSGTWKATAADFDDAMLLTSMPPEVIWAPGSESAPVSDRGEAS